MNAIKNALLANLLLAILAHGADTNVSTHIRSSEIWYSTPRLERIAKDYARQRKISFTFENTDRNVSIERRGTNTVAVIWFFSGMGKPVYGVEIVPSGKVLTNYLGIAVCGTGD